MAGRLFRKLTGGASSSGGSRRIDENRAGNDTAGDETGDDETHAGNVVIPTVEEEMYAGQVILSRDEAKGHWWSSTAIKKYVNGSFTRNIQSEFFTKWSDASEAQRQKMWNYFTSNVKSVDPGYDPYPDWQRRVTRRITQLVGGLQYCKNKPDWCPLSWWENLKDRKEKDPKWAEISKINQANRMAGAIEGKALATHALGRRSVSDVFDAMGGEATPYKIFEKTKKNKKGEWINPRAKQLDADFRQEMSQQSADGGTPDEFAAYYKAAKGYDKKSRVFGTGEELARRWFKPPGNKSQRQSSSYQPTAVTELSQKVNQLEEGLQASQEQMRLEREQWVIQQRQREEQWAMQQRQHQEEWRLQQEQFAAMQAAWSQMTASQPPGSCSSIPPRRRDDFADDGHGFGSNVDPLG